RRSRRSAEATRSARSRRQPAARRGAIRPPGGPATRSSRSPSRRPAPPPGRPSREAARARARRSRRRDQPSRTPDPGSSGKPSTRSRGAGASRDAPSLAPRAAIRYVRPSWSGARCRTSPRSSRTCASASARSTSASRRSGGIFDLAGLEKRAAELSERAASPDLWNDPERAQAVTRENARVQATVAGWRRQREGVDEAQVYLELAQEGDADALEELRSKVESVTQNLDSLELQQLLGGEHDGGNAIIEIHPGAGGLEAQDWAEMLLRMYLRWAERRGFKTDLLELQPGEGAGIKSATFSLEGPYAYGYAKAESGVHRLVRISPFDANARRQTSFA